MPGGTQDFGICQAFLIFAALRLWDSYPPGSVENFDKLRNLKVIWEMDCVFTSHRISKSVRCSWSLLLWDFGGGHPPGNLENCEKSRNLKVIWENGLCLHISQDFGVRQVFLIFAASRLQGGHPPGSVENFDKLRNLKVIRENGLCLYIYWQVPEIDWLWFFKHICTF